MPEAAEPSPFLLRHRDALLAASELGPVVDVFGWRFDYSWIGFSLVLTIACLIAVYLLFRPQRLDTLQRLLQHLPV